MLPSQSVMGARKSGARVGGRCSSQDSKRALEEQHQTLHQRGPGGMPRADSGMISLCSPEWDPGIGLRVEFSSAVNGGCSSR